MQPQPSLGHAEAYLNIHLSRSGRGHLSKTTGPFVTISRESGSGGSAFALALANRLERELPGETPWTVFDRNIVESMLQSRNLSPHIARFLPEDKVSEINASIGELVGLHPSLWGLIQRTNEMMRELARAGHVVLVGRGANFATAGIQHRLDLRLVASAEHRAKTMAAELGVTPAEARSHNTRVEVARRNYVRSVFGEDVANTDAYDLVINVGTVATEQAVNIALELLRHRVPVEA